MWQGMAAVSDAGGPGGLSELPSLLSTSSFSSLLPELSLKGSGASKTLLRGRSVGSLDALLVPEVQQVGTYPQPSCSAVPCPRPPPPDSPPPPRPF